MARTVFVLLLVLFLGMGFMLIRFSKDFNRLLPVQMPDNTAITNLQNWQEYSDPEGEFKVLLPKPPQSLTERTLDPKTNVHRKHQMNVSENENGYIFMINKITYPMSINKLGNVEDALTAVMNDMLAAKKENQMITMQNGQHEGLPSLDFSIENDQFIYKTRAIAADKTIYVLTSIGPKGTDLNKGFEFFVNSFDLTQH